MMNFIHAHKQSLKHLYSISNKSSLLMTFLLVAMFSQIYFGKYLFENYFFATLYCFGSFILVSIAYTIIRSNSESEISMERYLSLNYQLGAIFFFIFVHFTLLSGQFPQDYFLNKITSPFRFEFYSFMSHLGVSTKLAPIIINNIVCVVLPMVIIYMITKKNDLKKYFRIDIKILFLLFLLYLPVILFSGKSFQEIINYLPYYLFVAVIPEEILFRVYLQSRLLNKLKNPTNAILISSILFGLIHLPINTKMYGDGLGLLVCFGSNAFGGLLLGYLFYKTNSVPNIILFHLFTGMALS